MAATARAFRAPSAAAVSGERASLGASVRKAVLWRSGSQILSQVMSWGVTLAVIRLLDPGDYGLFAMTQAILNFATFLNGYGLVSALVQSDRIEPHRLRQAFSIMQIGRAHV